ncbi:MAG: DUF5908 family protein [Pseudomonadota bacterium]
MPVEIREIEIRAEIDGEPKAPSMAVDETEALRRHLLDACERKVEHMLRRALER